MSYTQRAKSEIMENRSLRSRFKNQQGYGLLLFGRTYGPGSITLATQQQEVARYYAAAITRAVKLTGTITTREEASGGQSAFQVRVDAPSDRRALLNHYAMLYPEGITYELLGGDEGAAAFVGGAFLACGSLADPEKKYHLEFAPPRPETAAVLTGILGEVGFLPKTAQRRGRAIIYTHDSTQMEDLLTFISCPLMSLDVMNAKILKERRNAANRAANCDNANIDKVVGAAEGQIRDIRRLMGDQGLTALPEELRELAALRLENPEASLRELGARLGLSRSGVNHRLRRIAELAGAIQKEK
ncbi:MAG: DNA-binding protein WhiA [Angelakisella sp.]|jgi:hypothetical protein|nr:DNA-binding protein WhiA [Angelakisella sp.]